MANFRLVLRSGTSAGKEYPLEKNELFIGRDMTNDVVINDPEVSRRHARLSLQGASYVIEDLASTNGTSVNNQRLMGPHLLRPGEVVTLGEHTNLIFESLQAMPEATMIAGGAIPATSVQAPAPVRPAQAEPHSQPPAFAGKIPAAPPPAPISAPPKKKSNTLAIVVVIILVVIILCACLVIASLYIVDSTNSWCTFKPILDIFLPGRCP